MLTDKVALITGGARGIGAGIARVMAGQGARVAVLDRDGPEAEKTAAMLPAPGMAVACDVAIEAAKYRRRRGGFGFLPIFGGLCCLLVIAGIVLAVVLISRNRRRR